MIELPAVKRIIYTEEELQRRIKELAGQISSDYCGRPLHLLAVLRGAIPFLADLAKYMTLDVTFDFLSVSRNTETNHVSLIKDLDAAIDGRDIILVEDIINEGETVSYLLQTLKLRSPKSLRICTLFDRPEAHKLPIAPDYVGFNLKEKFVVGYGLDYKQYFRNLPYIAELDL
ncbi:hypoxanthine phosphoribosyltransferase [bacterium]|nr:hypoxanthine phosphoribosyltransferase [bacterium]